MKLMKKKPKKGAKADAKPQTKMEPVDSFFNFFNPPQVGCGCGLVLVLARGGGRGLGEACRSAFAVARSWLALVVVSSCTLAVPIAKHQSPANTARAAAVALLPQTSRPHTVNFSPPRFPTKTPSSTPTRWRCWRRRSRRTTTSATRSSTAWCVLDRSGARTEGALSAHCARIAGAGGGLGGARGDRRRCRVYARCVNFAGRARGVWCARLRVLSCVSGSASDRNPPTHPPDPPPHPLDLMHATRRSPTRSDGSPGPHWRRRRAACTWVSGRRPVASG